MFSVLMTLTTPDNTGASRVAFEYAKGVIRNGGSVTIAHGRVPDANDGRKSLLSLMADVGIDLICEPRLERPIGDALFSDLAKVVKERQIECVVGNNQRDRSVAVNVAQRANVPVVICGHNQHVFRGKWPLPALKKRYYINAVRRADLIICSSRQVEQEFVEEFGVAGDKCVLMPHGIKLASDDAFTPQQIEELRGCFGVGGSDLLWCNVGRIDPQKGQDILLRAMKLIPSEIPYKLVLVGAVSKDTNFAENQRYEAELKKLVQQLPDPSRIVFAGWRDDYELIMAASNAYVHSARWEGLPLTVLAAMSAKRTIVAPNNSSRPPGFDDGVHGILVKPEDPQSLAEGLIKIADADVEELERMGSQARQLIEERYDMDRISDRFVDVVQDVIRRSRQSNNGLQKVGKS